MLKGSCLCGRVTFTVTGTPKGASVCHCKQCRKQSGNTWSSAYVTDENLTVSGGPTWYASSSNAKRGFCPKCGSFLFWRSKDENSTSFALGALDGPTGLHVEKHILTDRKGDYYEICDNLPQEQNP